MREINVNFIVLQQYWFPIKQQTKQVMALGKLLGVKNVFFLRINGKLVFNTGESKKEEGVWEVKGSEGAQPS